MLYLCSLIPESTAGTSRNKRTPLLIAAFLALGLLVFLVWLDRLSTATILEVSQRRLMSSKCSQHQITLGLAVLGYAADHGDRLPPAQKWCDLLRPYLRDATAFVCPATRNQRCSYAFNANLSGVRLADIPKSRSVVMFFESDRGWNAAGGPELLPAQPRHRSAKVDVAVYGHRDPVMQTSGMSRHEMIERDHWRVQPQPAGKGRR